MRLRGFCGGRLRAALDQWPDVRDVASMDHTHIHCDGVGRNLLKDQFKERALRTAHPCKDISLRRGTVYNSIDPIDFIIKGPPSDTYFLVFKTIKRAKGHRSIGSCERCLFGRFLLPQLGECCAGRQAGHQQQHQTGGFHG